MAYMPGFKRKCPAQGDLQRVTTVVNPLPPIGSKVIVQELRCFDRDWGDGRFVYMRTDNPNFTDAWGKPRELKVKGYTKGIENPLDPTNYVQLEFDVAGNKRTCYEKTMFLTSGSMRLAVIDDEPLANICEEEYEKNETTVV